MDKLTLKDKKQSEIMKNHTLSGKFGGKIDKDGKFDSKMENNLKTLLKK